MRTVYRCGDVSVVEALYIYTAAAANYYIYELAHRQQDCRKSDIHQLAQSASAVGDQTWALGRPNLENAGLCYSWDWATSCRVRGYQLELDAAS